MFVLSFILVLRLATLSSPNGGRSSFEGLSTQYFMRNSTGKNVFDLEISGPVKLGSIETCFYCQFSCLLRVTRSDSLIPENKTIE